MTEDEIAAQKAQLDRWEKLIGWEPRDTDGEADDANAEGFNWALDKIRSLPRNEAADLLAALAKGFVRQGVKMASAKPPRGCPAKTAAEHADFLCDVAEYDAAVAAVAAANKTADADAIADAEKALADAAAAVAKHNLGKEGLRAAKRNARRALGLGNKIEFQREEAECDWPEAFRSRNK